MIALLSADSAHELLRGRTMTPIGRLICMSILIALLLIAGCCEKPYDVLLSFTIMYGGGMYYSDNHCLVHMFTRLVSHPRS